MRSPNIGHIDQTNSRQQTLSCTGSLGLIRLRFRGFSGLGLRAATTNPQPRALCLAATLGAGSAGPGERAVILEVSILLRAFAET